MLSTEGPTAQIRVNYFATLRDTAGCAAETLTVAVGTTPASLYEELAQRHRFTLGLAEIRVAVNDEFAPADQALFDGDRVVFIPPVSGG